MVGAAWWFRHQTHRLIRRLQDPRWRMVLAVSPDMEGLNSRVWPAGVPRFPQGVGDLGDRMGLVFRSLPPGPVVIIGADIPGVSPDHIARALKALGSADAVLGPAPDGGYWLIGLARRQAVPAKIFAGVRWSTEYARSDTERSLQGLRIAQIDLLRDVDTIADLRPE